MSDQSQSGWDHLLSSQAEQEQGVEEDTTAPLTRFPLPPLPLPAESLAYPDHFASASASEPTSISTLSQSASGPALPTITVQDDSSLLGQPPADALQLPEAGPSRPPRTLSSMWSGNSTKGTGTDEETLAGPSKSTRTDKGAPRKRRKKDTVPQGRLVFSAEGMSVATPPPEEPKNGKSKARSADSRSRKSRGNQSRPSSTCTSPRKSPDPLDIIHVSSDALDDVEVLGSARGLGSQDDPVLVDDVKVKGPKKITFASEKAKPAHSFFSRAPPVATSGTATPAESTVTTGEVKKTHAFFVNGGAGKGKLRDGWGSKEGEQGPAPWPGGAWPNHCDAADVVHRQARLTHRERLWATAIDDSYQYRIQPLPSSPSQHIPSPPSFPPFILLHPAIAAILSDTRPDDARETWCERHRPRTASAVLGNEVEATYLRDWLHALSVGSSASRRIVRRVPRKRATNPDTAWIVDDIGMFGEPFSNAVYDDQQDEIPEPLEEPDLPLGVRPNSYPPITNWVANTILLTGPSGTGKSAAVHAAATELGWNVFEVYPGIGRRTGANLHALVGDVGKNHTVDGKEKKKANGIAAMLGKPGSAREPIELEPEEVKEKEKETRQSLILIDEADILFDERETFWPAVVALIAESRRPVVITCNDVRLIPINSLPLQTILHFQPPPSYVAQAYLGAIAQRHGVSVDIAQLYADCTRAPYDLVAQPLPPNGNEPLELFDLRAAINQMQADRGHASDRHEHRRSHTCIDLVDLVRQIETLSFADACIAPRDWELMEILEVDRYGPTTDDQDGISQLLKPDLQELCPIIAACSRASDIADALVSLSGGRLPVSQLQHDQIHYVRSLLPILDPLIPLSSRLLPNETLFLDVIPALREMVRVDDHMEIADRAAVHSGDIRLNRRGRAIRKASEGYERWIELDPEALEEARSGGLHWDL